jgi:hypothetical protein
MHRFHWIAAAAIALLACSGFALLTARKQAHDTQRVYSSRTNSYTSTEDVSTIPLADILELMDRDTAGLPPPQGFTFDDFQGRVTGELTGMCLPSGEQQLLVTVIDDSEDTNDVVLEVEGTVVCRASREAGSIVDRNGFGIATLVGYVVPSAPLTVKVSWVYQDGFTSSEEVSLR